MNTIVVFDLDGVLLDFESAWARCASRELGRPVRKVSDAYDLQDRYALSSRWIRARAISLGGLIPSGRIICLGEDASPHDRAEILDDLHAQAFVDDQSPNANAAVGIVAAPVLLHRGYQGLEPPAHGVTVIDDLRDFPETLQGFLTHRLPA